MTRGWSRFYDATGEEPRSTVLAALERFERAGLAVDLGCGTGRDTFELLRRGWRVVAIDGESEAIERLRRRSDLPPAADARLETRVARFEDASWPAADLVNSSFSLPFCPPEAFGGVWRRIVESLGPGGRFAGQLFGDRDEWAGEDGITVQTRGELIELFDEFVLERLEEVDEDGSTAVGELKHWHLFHVVARKRG